MTIEDALAILDRVQVRLNDTEESVFRQSWMEQPYQTIAEELNFATEYIRAVGAKLWHLLSEAFGERVTKQNFKAVIQRWGRHQTGQMQAPTAATSGHQDWGEAIDVSAFFGREEALTNLEQWIVTDRCQIVAILGSGGMGKTSLSIKLAQQIQQKFEYVIWRSLRHAPSLQELLQNLLQFFAGSDLFLDQSFDQQQSHLIQYLRQHRCLVVLDNVETILAEGFSSRHHAGHYRSGYEGYGELMRCLGEVAHQSCLVLTSREKPSEIDMQEGDTTPVRSLTLTGITPRETEQLFKTRGPFSANLKDWQLLTHHYGGNPLALKMVAPLVQELFDSNLAEFLEIGQQGNFIFDDIRALLAQQFTRLSADERAIMYWLAINREWVSFSALQQDLLSPLGRRNLWQGLQSLRRRFLVEKNAAGLYSQQPVVMEYVIERLIEQFCVELCQEEIGLLNSHALMKAEARRYIRDSQIQFILVPIAQQLRDRLYSQTAVVTLVNRLILKLQAEFSHMSGYAGGNLVNLLRHLQVDLTGYDLSHLTLWQADLQGLKLHYVNLSYCRVDRCSLTEVMGNIWAIAISPDGELLAASDTLNCIHLWRLADGRKCLTLNGHPSWAVALAFSPICEAASQGGTPILASAGEDRTVRLWDAITGQCLQTLEGHGDWVLAVAFSPDGQQLASSSADGAIYIWDVQTGRRLHHLQGHQNWTRAIAFLPVSHPLGQSLLVSASADDTICLWDTQTGTCLQAWEANSQGVWALAIHPDGQMLVTGGGDATVKAWDLETGHCLQQLRGHHKQVRAIAISPDGQTIASGCEDWTMRLWDAFTGECTATLQGHHSAIWALAFARSDCLVSGSLDQSIYLWDRETGQCISAKQGYTDFVLSVAIQSGVLACGRADHRIQLWDLASGSCIQSLSGHSNWVLSVSFDPYGGRLASSGSDQSIRIWDLASGQCLSVLQGHQSWVPSVQFSPTGKMLASAGFDQTIRLWDVTTGLCLKVFSGHRGRVWSVVFSPDGRHLASTGEDCTVRIWNIQTGACRSILVGHTARGWCVRFSPNGYWLASGGEDGTIRLWDWQNDIGQQVLQGHRGRVRAIAFTPDSSLLVSGGEDTTLRVWNSETGDCLSVLKGHSSRIWSVAFPSDSPVSPSKSSPLLLASGGEDEIIGLWDISSGRLQQILRNPKPYHGMQIHGIMGLSEAEKSSLKALGASDREWAQGDHPPLKPDSRQVF